MRTVDLHIGVAIDLPAGWIVVDQGFEVLRKTSSTTTVEINFTVGPGTAASTSPSTCSDRPCG